MKEILTVLIGGLLVWFGPSLNIWWIVPLGVILFLIGIVLLIRRKGK